jgi:O-antigen/teichoic acid export membrane protein
MRAAVSTLNPTILKWASSERAGVAVRGGAWSFVGYGGVQLLRATATLVLARHFLGPESFGLVGLVAVFLTGLGMFSELGLVANIVQHSRGDESRFLNTAFSIQAGRGLAIWIVAVLAAYPLALFYQQPQLMPLLVVGGLSEVIRGLTSTTAWTLIRHVRLRNITLLAIASEVVALAVAILWAVVSPSAWALVIRTVAGAAVYAVGSHLLTQGRSTFGWEPAAAKEILHFGGWISLATAAHFLASQGERLILGKFVTAAELGCFSLALMISSVPAGGISQFVNQTFLPMISSTARTSLTETVRDFLVARRIFFALALATGIAFVACGKPLVALLLSPKYAMTGWMLQLLGLRVALDMFAAPASALVLAYGQSKYSAGANATRVILMLAGIWVAFLQFGIRGAVVSLVISQALSYFPLIVGVARLLPGVAGTELRFYAILLVSLAAIFAAFWSGI